MKNIHKAGLGLQIFYSSRSGVISRLINLAKQWRIMKSDNIQPETTCGYCTQGKHSECRGYECACAEKGHP